MALTVVVRAQVGSHARIRRDAHRGRLVEPDARTHHAGEARRRDTGGFEVAGEADAAPLVLLLRILSPGGEVPVVGSLQRALEDAWKVAAVVGRPDRRLVRHRFPRDEVAAPDLGAVDAELARSLVDQALEDVAGFGAPR